MMEAHSTEREYPVTVTVEDRLRLLEAGEQVARIGSWEWQPKTHERLWSRNMFRLLGLDPDIPGSRVRAVLGRVHPRDRDLVREFFDAARSGLEPAPVEARVMTDGHIRYLRGTITQLDLGEGGARRIIGVVQDIT